MEEFERSPVAVIGTAATIAISAGSLLVAFLQYKSPASAAAASAATGQSMNLNVANLLVVLSYFLAATFSAASLIRFIGRHYGFAAFVLSIPAAVLTSFSSLIVLNLVPPRAMTAAPLVTAQELALYGTIAIFVAVNGLAVIRDLIAPTTTRLAESAHGTPAKASRGGELGAIFILLLVWGVLVSSGLSKLVEAFIDSPAAK